jgi:hypothetical protein
LYQIIHDTKAGVYGHGIFPDVSLPRSFNDKVDHRDLELQYLLEKEERLSKNVD